MLERRGKIVALVIGDGGMSAEDFLSADSADLFK